MERTSQVQTYTTTRFLHLFFTCFLYLQGPFGLLEKVQEEEEKKLETVKTPRFAFQKAKIVPIEYNETGI